MASCVRNICTKHREIHQSFLKLQSIMSTSLFETQCICSKMHDTMTGFQQPQL